jgi:hypothetical protein
VGPPGDSGTGIGVSGQTSWNSGDAGRRRDPAGPGHAGLGTNLPLTVEFWASVAKPATGSGGMQLLALSSWPANYVTGGGTSSHNRRAATAD